jgi:DNA-binding MarR family transcriptional regulator
MVPLAYRGPFLAIYAVAQLQGRLLQRHLDGSGLRPEEYALYSVLLAEEPTTPTRLSEILGLRPTTLSSLLRQMSERKHLRRKPNPDDGRSVLLSLTPSGRAITRRAMTGFGRAIESFRDHLDIPEADLLAALEGMAAALEQAHVDADVAEGAEPGAAG